MHVKSGKTEIEIQKYKCKHCGKVYKPNPKGRKYSEEIKKASNKTVYEIKQ